MFTKHEYALGTGGVEVPGGRAACSLVGDGRRNGGHAVWGQACEQSLALNHNVSATSASPLVLYVDFQFLKHLNTVLET